MLGNSGLFRTGSVLVFKRCVLGAALAICLFALLGSQCRKSEISGEFAPPEAYLEGSKHPYFGSENPWDRRFFTEHIRQEYKRRGQRQILDIMEGRVEDAIRYCRQLLAEDPNDLESRFNLCVAQLQLGQLDSALATMRLAIQRGLPFERFLAGPRDLLRPLHESAEFQRYYASHPVELLHGPMVGCVTDTSACFWVRTFHEVPVQIVLSRSKDFGSSLASQVVRTKAESDYTAKLRVTGLEPDQLYYYHVVVDDKAVFRTEPLSFRTYPRRGEPATFVVGFGGGAGYAPWNERMWDTIRAYRPLAFLFMGDNVYINMPDFPNALHYYTYYRRQSRPEFRRLVSSCSIYAIWDDHDAATDDCWLGPYKDKPPWKLPLLEVFKQNWINPGYGDPDWPGCWFSFSIADVDFFMLDGRMYRTNPFDKNPTMLGPVQKAWLKDKLAGSKATFKVVASPVEWSFGAKPGTRDSWSGFPDERQELFDFLAEHGIDGVVLISADRHRSEAWRIERKHGYPLYEFESSRLTNEHVHELVPGTLFGYNEKQSFGLLKFDTTVPDPTVTFEIVNIDGEVVYSLTVRRSQISARG